VLRQILGRRLDQQRKIVMLSDQSRIQHLTAMGVIENMGSVTLSSAERALRIELSRKRARELADARREWVRARQAQIDRPVSTERKPAPPLGTYRR
jgi:hypothetical protein